ncbi:zinc finger protein 628-like isoform X1 [Amphibalanus amphitrite]|uniref:zinc finger protein 628-like isoform X1 n=1 Tax=Amphibalanus amphitrite TaxID=1232801 RepID=UPI001C904E11|nr:zinc finger protein 628-like isoform X1 [Amphibalanus amphitrite]
MHILLSFSQKAKRLQIAAAPRSSCQLKLKLWKKELKLVILLTQVGWQDLGQGQHKPAAKDQTTELQASTSVLTERHKSQSRLWTVSADGKTYQCTLCDKKFTQRTYMYTHVRIHTGARPHACSSCSRTFRSSSALSEHERSAHTSGAQFSCELCGQTLLHASSLRQHLRRHRQPAAHRCADCGKTFHRASQLREHAAVHSQRRPHACAVCGKTFKNPSGLVYHGRIHSGERPHQCGVCGARFRTSSNLARHGQSQHGAGAKAAAEGASTVSGRTNPPPPRPPSPPPVSDAQTVTQPPQPPPPPPRFDLLQPAGFDVTGPEFVVTHHHHHHHHHHQPPSTARGAHGAPPPYDRSLHELLPVPMETYRPL